MSVGDHDTAAFAVGAIRQWWTMMGRRAYPAAIDLYVTADAGGSDGYRPHAWKVGLQRLAGDLGLRFTCRTSRPAPASGTRLSTDSSAHLTENWRVRALLTFETLVESIGHTEMATGLRLKAKLVKRRYRTGVVVTTAEMRSPAIDPHWFPGDWNYAVRPRATRSLNFDRGPKLTN